MWSLSQCPTYIEVPLSKGNAEERMEIWAGIYTMLEQLSKESGKNLRSYRTFSQMLEKAYKRDGRLIE